MLAISNANSERSLTTITNLVFTTHCVGSLLSQRPAIRIVRSRVLTITDGYPTVEACTNYRSRLELELATDSSPQRTAFLQGRKVTTRGSMSVRAEPPFSTKPLDTQYVLRLGSGWMSR